MAKDGKDFEEEIGKSLAAMAKAGNRIAMGHHNSNSLSPLCDHVVAINGQGVLLEEKEIRSERFPFGNVTDNERTKLDAFTKAGWAGWVLIKLILMPAAPRVFACTWQDWKFWELFAGYDPKAAKQKRGCASFLLLPDADRPPHFIELQRVQRRDMDGNSLGLHWDLTSILRGEK